MLKIAVRGIRNHKARFAATTFAVVLGVSFVVASFVLADTIRSAFDDLFSEITEGVELSVRSSDAIGSSGPEGSQRRPVREELLEVVHGTEGVAVASGQVEGFARVVTPDGEPVTATGAPLIGVGWGPHEELSPITLERGAKPDGPGEVAVDRGTAEDFDLEVGDRVTVEVATGVVPAELVGIFTFGETNSLLGARLTAFEPEAAQAAFDSEGFFQSIAVALEPDADVGAVAQRLEGVLPDGLEVVTGQTVADENASEVNEFVDVFGNVLLGFAAVALFVSAFYIHNTFTIILGQRTRELGLLRAVGASPGQVTRSVLAEAVVIGVVASVVGVGFGLLTALGLEALLGMAGLDFPATGLELRARSWVLAVVVGVGVTLLSSLAPARRAGRVSPVVAMGGAAAAVGAGSRRSVVGVVLVGVGAVLIALGLAVAQGAPAVLGSLGVGAVAVFVGIARLGPLFAGPVAAVLGAPLRRVFGMPGRLATENASRNPERTASAASALMIGLALVTMAAVAGRSMTATFADAVEESVAADLVVSASGFGSFSPAFAEEIAELEEVGAVTPVRFGSFRFGGEERSAVGVDPRGAQALFELDALAGSLGDLDASSLAVHEDPAEDLGLGVGDEVDVEFTRSGETTLRVAAVYSDATLVGNYLVSTEGWGERFNVATDSLVLVGAAEGVDVEELEEATTRVAEAYPALAVENRAEFRESQQDQFSQILVAVNGMLGLAVLIAGLGIANTMALSVFERTRELGLLRAVGMTSRQARRMIRWESVVVAVFGGVLGVAVGLLFGVVVVAALPSSVAARLVVPTTTVVLTLVAAGVVGLLAAIFPARRAGRLRVLSAIAHE